MGQEERRPARSLQLLRPGHGAPQVGPEPVQPGAEAPMGLDTRGKPLQVPCSRPGRAGCWPGGQLRLEGGGGNRGAERPCSALCVRASRLGCVTPRQRDKAASSYFPSLSSSQEPSRPREHSPAPKAAGRTVATLSRLLSWPRAHGSPLSSWLRAWVAGLVTQAGTRTVHAHSHVHTRTQPPVPHPLPPGPGIRLSPGPLALATARAVLSVARGLGVSSPDLGRDLAPASLTTVSSAPQALKSPRRCHRPLSSGLGCSVRD